MSKKNSIIKEEWNIIKKNGQVIRGVTFRPDLVKECFPAVIFSHGFNGCFKDLIHHGKGYAENGIVCVFFDFCGGGMNSESDGEIGNMTVLTEAEDLEYVMDFCRSLPYVDKEHLFLQGESQGGFVSAIVGERRKEDVTGLILWYPAFIIPDDARKRTLTGSTEVFGIMLSKGYDKVAMTIDNEALQRNFEKPVLLIHGDRDELVPITYSENAASTYQNATLRIIEGAGHGFEGTDSVKAREWSIEFVKSGYKGRRPIY